MTTYITPRLAVLVGSGFEGATGRRSDVSDQQRPQVVADTTVAGPGVGIAELACLWWSHHRGFYFVPLWIRFSVGVRCDLWRWWSEKDEAAAMYWPVTV